MSSTLHWRPIPAPGEGTFSDAFKHLVRRYFDWAGPGAIGESDAVERWTPVSRDILPWLEGVVAGTSDRDVREDALRLHELVSKHGAIELKEEW